ncbi:MAG: hypothetical protein ABIF40_00540 [archaeon]
MKKSFIFLVFLFSFSLVYAECATNVEDVATFFEPLVHKDYAIYQELMTPDSKKYDSRYEEKFDLGYEYGFVSDEEYWAVIALIE